MRKRDVTNIVLLLLFKIIIEYLYVDILHPQYGYLGLSLNFNIVKSIESYILMVVIYCIIDKRKDKPSAIFLQILFVLSIIPTLSIYGLKNESRLALYISVLSFVFTLLIAKFLPKIKLVKLKNAKVLYFVVIWGLTLLTYGLLIRDNGIPGLSAFNFTKTYSYRSNVVYNSLTGYLVPWQARVVNIFLIAVFYLRKEYKKMIIPFFLQIILFLITAHKSYLFSPVAVIGLFYIIKKRNMLKVMLSGLISLNIIAYATYKLNISGWLIALITHRQHYIPAQIGFYFFDFFSRNEKLLFSEGFIGKILGLDSPYSLSVFNMIGDVYFGRPEMHANTWYVADSFANGGVIGVISIAIILGVTLVLIDSIKQDYRVVLAALFMPILSLTNGALLTAYFTNGILVAIMILFLYSNYENKNNSLENLGG